MEAVERSITVNVPVTTAYNQWTQFEEFPQFMEGIISVRQQDDTRLFWHANIAGKDVEWESRIIEQTPDRQISWESITGAYNTGALFFEPEGDEATRITLRLQYEPSGFFENIGSALGFVDLRVENDLRRFKDFIESRGHETGAWRGEIHQSKAER